MPASGNTTRLLPPELRLYDASRHAREIFLHEFDAHPQLRGAAQPCRMHGPSHRRSDHIVRQHLFEPAWKALSSLDLRDAQEYINTASVERKSALNPTTGVRPSRAIGCESIHRLQRVDLRHRLRWSARCMRGSLKSNSRRFQKATAFRDSLARQTSKRNRRRCAYLYLSRVNPKGMKWQCR